MSRPWKTLVLALSSACVFAPPHLHAIPLFNGTDLAGWTKLGGDATYHVDGGEIVGTSAPPGSPNAFLVTQANYSDFALELDFKISDPPFNSGVQIRSQSLPSHNNGRVFGYQVEIDPDPVRRWSGGLYFEGGSPQRGAGWLDDLSDNPAAQAAFTLGQWNRFRILAVGRRIQTWINDVPAVDFTDNHATGFLPSGFVGLQVHSVSSGNPGPFEVRWRDITLNEIAPAPNTLMITVDPLTGIGRLKNPTQTAIIIDGYTIFSSSSSLRPAGGQWLSLADQGLPGWQEAGATASTLSELNPLGQLSIPAGGSFNLGSLFDAAGGMRDLTFEYGIPGIPQETAGAVAYRLAADFDNDGQVDRFDLAAWNSGFAASSGADADSDGDSDGNDFLVWQRQLGASPATTVTAASIPEPSTALSLAGGWLALVRCLTTRRAA